MNTPRYRKNYGRLLAAGAAILTVSGGCASVDENISSVSGAVHEGADLKAAAKAAKASKKALEHGKYDRAVTLAEDAVMAAPQEASYRARLGQAYQKSGRFASAEQAFAEARVLGDGSAKTVISHALALTAIGETDRARALLIENRPELPASDYGLALALLGDRDMSVEVLEDAVRNGPSSSQARQNLALAYAIAGRWRESQLVGQRDLAPGELRQRITEWAQLARPGAYQERVAAILGVTPVSADAGMPVLLALDQPEIEAGSVAGGAARYSNASLAAVNAEPAVGSPNDLFRAEPEVLIEKTQTAAFAATDVAATIASAPLNAKPAAAQSTSETSPVQVAKPLPAPSTSAPSTKFVKPAETAPTAAPGPQYVLQLGSFSTARNADHALDILKRRYSLLDQLQPVKAEVTIGGRQYHRVGASSIGSEKDARALCRKIRNLGGECLVRPVAGFRSS